MRSLSSLILHQAHASNNTELCECHQGVYSVTVKHSAQPCHRTVDGYSRQKEKAVFCFIAYCLSPTAMYFYNLLFKM